jgi:signal transduction histidine kinase
MLDELAPLLANDPERALELSDELLAECGQALEALRELARGIFPAILADQGVVSALEAYVLQARLPIDVAVATDVTDRYDQHAEATVYFCVIQALANAGAYAPESNVVVRIGAERGQLSFSVTDDGPGTDAQRLHAGADIGDMRDRVEAIGGEFTATSAPGAGTVVSGSVPIDVLVLA